jgi:dipeptidyl aminopeptidase/acylaminoacyl peptidase
MSTVSAARVTTQASGPAPLIPREVLFGNPERLGPRLSPDGRRLAYIAPSAGVLNVWVRTVGRSDDRPITADRGRGIRACFWARNSRQILYVQDTDGDENWRVYAVPAEGGAAVTLTPFDGVQAQILAVPPEHPDVILLGLNNRVPQFHDVYLANLTTGQLALVQQNDLGASAWEVDHQLRVRLAQIPQADGGFVWLHRPDASTPWKELFRVASDDALTTNPLGFAADNQTLYVLSSIGSNTTQLRTLDVATGREQVLASDNAADVSDVLVHPLEHRVQAVAFLKERPHWTALEPTVASDLAALASLHHGDVDVVSRDHADHAWIVAYSQDVGPVAYYAFDRASQRAEFLFSARPALSQWTLAPMQPVHLRARDGLEIHAYLTLPTGVSPKRLPAILNVHGGPWARDTWGYDPEAQWLANRGYAVLQVNYRGSTGYGKAFVNAGDREWGGAMQDDLTDAVTWLISQGIADPKRVGIFGGSYGGYAVLAGLTKTPDVFACGVDIVGPSNLLTFINSIPPYWEPVKAMFHRRVGHPEQEVEWLTSRSPLFSVDRIRAPLLIAQGANDPRVKREESLQIVDALKRAGKTAAYMEFPDEGHGFARPENRLRFYAAAEQFLATHLGGRSEPSDGPRS